MHCDQHVVKIPLEAVQLLYTAWAVLAGTDERWRETAPWNKDKTRRGYLPTHVNHPLAIWVRESEANYLLCQRYARKLCREYWKRTGKTLSVQAHLRWLGSNIPPTLPRTTHHTPIPLCIGTEKGKPIPTAATLSDAVEPYRRYYRETKLKMARWKHSQPPAWIGKQK